MIFNFLHCQDQVILDYLKAQKNPFGHLSVWGDAFRLIKSGSTVTHHSTLLLRHYFAPVNSILLYVLIFKATLPISFIQIPDLSLLYQWLLLMEIHIISWMIGCMSTWVGCLPLTSYSATGDLTPSTEGAASCSIFSDREYSCWMSFSSCEQNIWNNTWTGNKPWRTSLDHFRIFGNTSVWGTRINH